ncbi:MAG TPA: DNA cytosine methyltransferase [Patescibacteria group bacterium]|nr:DNA cytosine methyltransferase [Patescibacteria group bacterium]
MGATVSKAPIIDLFAGAGGLSLGALGAGGDVRLLVDTDPTSCATARLSGHHAGAMVLEGNVNDLSGDSLRGLAGLTSSDPLVVVGGPPCQPFSKAAYWSEDGDDAAYRRARTLGIHAARPITPTVARPDPRRSLVWEFWRLVHEANADAFLMENVPSILHPRNRGEVQAIVDAARSDRFHVRVVQANAVEYGVPQRRHRVFVLASKAGMPSIPTPTHGPWPHGDRSLSPVVTSGTALKAFAGPEYFEHEEVVTGRWADHLRDIPPGWNYKHHTEWAGHPRPSFVTETRFWNFLLKLDPASPSWTIAANPGPWTGPFHWDGRRLRSSEMAALQGFPAGYKFVGTRRERVRQIGNAVPPPLAEAMVRTLLETLRADLSNAA